MEKLLISNCFLGNNCKYDGGNNYLSKINELKKKYILVPICPEVDGGLSTPREPSEIRNNRVYSKSGIDVTNYFETGALKALQTAKKEGITKALLKESSPSCGKSLIHDGTFTGNKIIGIGITARLLLSSGIKIYNENEIDKLL